MKDELGAVYFSFVLRMWYAGSPAYGPEGAEAGPWRFSLEEIHSGKRIGFNSLQRLQDYLRQIETQAGQNRPGEENRSQPPGLEVKK